MDEFDQAEARGQADDGSEVSFGLFAAERDALKALEASDAVLDAGAGFVESAREEGRLVLFVGLVGNDGSDAALPSRFAIGLSGVTLVADDGARLNVGPDVEQGSKSPSKASPRVRSKAMMSPGVPDFAWILVVKPPRERPSAGPSCPPLLRPPTHARGR